MNDILHTIELGNIDGFDLTFNALVEDLPLDAIFFDYPVTDIKELARQIDNGELEYFCAQVTASKHGVELASNYLGACCYKSYQDFIGSHDHISDMKYQAIKEAQEKIKLLNS